MIVFAEIVFWISMASIAGSYVLYPSLLFLFSNNRKVNFAQPLHLPSIEMVFAAHNEEVVLEKKIRSVLASDYPIDKLKIAIGSDCSTDATNQILKNLEKEFPDQIRIKLFNNRQGKSQILNQLASQSQAECLLLTDANIIFKADTIIELLKGLHHNNAGACGGSINYISANQKGISAQEDNYLNFENKLKFAESSLWGITMGLEGGCYLIKREFFPTIPPLFFMEDFFVTLSVLSKGLKVHFNPKATVSEDVSTLANEEYQRKIRISIGNFQNLNHFKSLITSKFWPIGFSFLMHKVLRWFTPFFMILIFLSCLFLATSSTFYLTFGGFYLFLMILGALGVVFSQKNIGAPLKFIGHFFYMNLALLIGFIKYIKGVESNAWRPTARNQK